MLSETLLYAHGAAGAALQACAGEGLEGADGQTDDLAALVCLARLRGAMAAGNATALTTAKTDKGTPEGKIKGPSASASALKLDARREFPHVILKCLGAQPEA